jgi:hypothetical protein
MLLDRSVLEEEPLVDSKIVKCFFAFLKILTAMQSFRKSWKLPHFSQQLLRNALKGCWTAAWKCSKGVGKPLGNAQRLLESLWEILKEYRKATRKWPNNIRQPIGEEVEL